MKNNKITDLRHELHKHPELSHKEFQTVERISDFINAASPDEVISLGSTGKAFVFNGKEKGKTLMFRAELDALPITEESILEYSSSNSNVSHSCGHDGHMAIVAGLALKIAEMRPKKGRVILLFQPAEEVGEGAREIVNDPAFIAIAPDYIFALHNIPGAETNHILLKSDTFAAASKGMTVKLIGKTSHAAEPENGISPVNAIQHIIKNLSDLASDKSKFRDMILLTFVHIRMGEIAFGTSPGYAEIMITLRAFDNDDMDLLTRQSEEIISKIAEDEKLKVEISYSEVFPAVVNQDDCVNFVVQAAKENNLPINNLQTPFKWSEDFSYFTQNHPGCMFGLGAGINQAQLHNSDYDFPDELLKAGINMFFSIYKQINF
ncbi:MAG: amidohydrolase [Desulfobulbaceae bacterium]|nr:amidohydrolase [Desulfobulbaceae bacterium]